MIPIVEDFSTESSVSNNWTFLTGNAAFIPPASGPGTEMEAFLPSIANGALQLTLRTYNPTAKTPGDSFYGSDIVSTQMFDDDNGGIAFTAVAKLNTTVPGLDGGIFSYGLVSPTSHNEIDFESLSADAEQTNTYLDQPPNTEGSPSLVPDPGLTTYQTYTMEWFPNEVLWFVNGVLVQKSTVDVPQGPMSFDLDFWAYDPNPLLQPTANAADDQTYTFDVQYVSVTPIAGSAVPPILSGGGNGATYAVGGAVATMDPGLAVADGNSTTLLGGTVAIGAGFSVGDTLSFINQNGISGTYYASIGTLVLTGKASLAAYQTALDSITFSSTNLAPWALDTTQNRVITWAVTDGTLSSNPVASTIIVAEPGNVVVSNVVGQPYSAYERLFDNGVYAGIDYFFTNVVAQPYSSYEYDFSPGNDFLGSKFFYTGITGEAYTGYEYDYNGGSHVTRVDFTGVGDASYSSYEYDFVGGVFAGSKFEVTSVQSDASYSSYELDFNSANTFSGESFFFTDLPGQSYTGLEEDLDANQTLVRLLLSGVTGQPYSSLELDFNAGTYTGYKACYSNVSGQSYTSEQVDVSASNELQKVIYSGMSSTPYSSVELDYTNAEVSNTIYDFTQVAGASYHAYQIDENSSGLATQEILDNNDGSHTQFGLGAASQTFTSLGDDTMTGGGANETFLFTQTYGADAITDFASFASGPSHDTISLPGSEFDNFAAVLASASNVGSSVLIKAADGDTLTLAGLDTTTLAGLTGDFTFHS